MPEPTVDTLSRSALRNRDRKLDPDIARILNAIEQHVLALETLIKRQKSWIFAIQSIRDYRAKITEHVNALTRLICKNLPQDRLMQFTDFLFPARCVIMQAYLSSVEPGQYQIYLKNELESIRLSGKNWEEIIASILALNTVRNRALPFVEDLLEPWDFDLQPYILPPIVPTTWEVLRSEGHHFKIQSVEFFTHCFHFLKDGAKFVLEMGKTALNHAKDRGKQGAEKTKAYWKAARIRYKKWREKPIPPVMTRDGYYVAQPIEDEQISFMKKYVLSYFTSLQTKVGTGVRDGVHEISEVITHFRETSVPTIESKSREPGTPIDRYTPRQKQ